MQYEMIRYVFAGVCTTGVNIGVFSVLRYGTGCGMQAANVISILAAILFAFVVNKYFVFRQKGIYRKGMHPFCGDARDIPVRRGLGNVFAYRRIPDIRDGFKSSASICCNCDELCSE